MLQAWQNEKCAPDILHYASDLIPMIVEQIRAQASPNSLAAGMSKLEKHVHGRFSELSWCTTASLSIHNQSFSFCSPCSLMSSMTAANDSSRWCCSLCHACTPPQLMPGLGCTGSLCCCLQHGSPPLQAARTCCRRGLPSCIPAAAAQPAADCVWSCHY